MYEYYPDRPKVLLVDEYDPNLSLIRTFLSCFELEIEIARSAQEALDLVSQSEFDMILLHVQIVGMDGFDLCKAIKSISEGRDLSILFMSDTGDEDEKSKGFESGADDYLVKPFYEKEVQARVKLHLKKHHLIKHLKSLLKRSYHELYNPLTIIKTSAEMYGYRYPKNHYVDTMHAAAKSLQIIYEDLYYALGAKRETPKEETIDMGRFLKKRMEYFNLMAEIKHITIDLQTEDGCFVSMIPADVQRIVDNTLSNAIKYSFENSVIRVSLSKKGRVILRITNEGATIINPHHIFTDGYREAYNTIGMGIGLGIVSSICHAHGIKAEVDSAGG